ncbi:MAG: TIGR04255 family protein [Elusimicrobia bacterium]|nr:TIGR04255 family protein [Elusimicrobiota bacterium]
MSPSKARPNEVFPNAPLVEAVFEIRFDGTLSVDCNKHKIQACFFDRFPALGVPVATSTPQPQLAVPLRLTSKDENELIQFSAVNFSYHLKKYTHFAGFKRAGLDACKKFVNIVGLKTCQRVGLRYINHIPVLRQSGLIPLRHYLNFGFSLPDTIPEKLEQFSTRLITKLGDGELRTNIVLQQSPGPHVSEWIVLDFDFIIESKMKFNNLSVCLEASHKHTEDVFLSLISEKYLHIMRQRRK